MFVMRLWYLISGLEPVVCQPTVIPLPVVVEAIFARTFVCYLLQHSTHTLDCSSAILGLLLHNNIVRLCAAFGYMRHLCVVNSV